MTTLSVMIASTTMETVCVITAHTTKMIQNEYKPIVNVYDEIEVWI